MSVWTAHAQSCSPPQGSNSFGHPADFTGANDIMFPVTACPGPR